ncbi:transcription initiation factor TFIID subunit 4-like [Moschus berezovskii]|uniref:transcription initiation factor TFIID subunit 4-like n=1 Tax=Moschus berezovskii TaxID=68408 RepID=UPI0024446401|nr:transcription initiation factor TFIID subunit 4-like [Moschus berezovskii]
MGRPRGWGSAQGPRAVGEGAGGGPWGVPGGGARRSPGRWGRARAGGGDRGPRAPLPRRRRRGRAQAGGGAQGRPPGRGRRSGGRSPAEVTGRAGPSRVPPSAAAAAVPPSPPRPPRSAARSRPRPRPAAAAAAAAPSPPFGTRNFPARARLGDSAAAGGAGRGRLRAPGPRRPRRGPGSAAAAAGGAQARSGGAGHKLRGSGRGRGFLGVTSCVLQPEQPVPPLTSAVWTPASFPGTRTSLKGEQKRWDPCLSDSATPWTYSLPGSSVHGDSPGKNTGVRYCDLLQGIFLTQGSNPCLMHCKKILYQATWDFSSWIRGGSCTLCIGRQNLLTTGPPGKYVTHWRFSGLLLLKAGVFQGALVVKNPPAQARRFERPRF